MAAAATIRPDSNFILAFRMARISTSNLAALCRRAGTSLDAGLDSRTVWRRESERGKSRQQTNLQKIAKQVEQGGSTAQGIADCGNYFPPLLHDMVDVGERSGRLDQVLLKLADHYDHQIRLRRTFLAGIIWPAMQLGAALLIVGILIWVMGFIGEMTGQTIDILGFGLVGTRGLVIYLAGVATIAAGIWFFIAHLARGGWGSATLTGLLHRIPVLGRGMMNLALSRFAWALAITQEAGMDARQSLDLSLRSSQSPLFLRSSEIILKTIDSRQSFCEALAAGKVFPDEFLHAMETGETSGRLPETMQHASEQCRLRAQAALNMVALFAGFACWGLVALVIIVLIFRLAFFYLAQINSLL